MHPMERFPLRACVQLVRALALAGPGVLAGAQAVAAQAQPAFVSVVPVSELKSDFVTNAIQSADGRFVGGRGFTGRGFTRYDRVTKTWADVPDLDLGSELAWSPNGRFIVHSASAEGINGQYLWLQPMDSATGLPTGTARRITNIIGRFPAWSPDSRRVAFHTRATSGFDLMTTPFNGGEPELLLHVDGTGTSTAWSRDGQYVLATYQTPDRKHTTARVHVATKRAETFSAPAARMLGYSPDGRSIAYSNDQLDLLFVVSAADGKVLDTRRYSRWIDPVGWSSTVPGEIAAVEDVIPTHIEVVSLQGGAIRSLTPIQPAFIEYVAYSPDGRQLAFAREVPGGPDRLFVMNSDGSNLHPLGQAGDITLVQWSPSGAQIAYKTRDPGALHLVDVASGSDRTVATAVNGEPGFGAVAWRADGKALRYVSFLEGTRASGREVREVVLGGADRRVVPLSSPGNAHFVNDTLLLLQREDGITAVSLRSGEARTLYTGPMRSDGGFGLSKDGTWIAFTAYPPGPLYYSSYPMLVNLTTGQSRRIPYSLGGENSNVYFHPDGQNLLVYSCRLCENSPEKWDLILQPMNGDPARVLTASQASYRDFEYPTISPDGSSIAFQAEQSYNSRVVTLRMNSPE